MSSTILPLVSTIIPVFDRRELLEAAVKSVLEQSHRPIEIIVVDDGSSEPYQTFYATLEARHPELRVIEQANQGPGVARQAGLDQAMGEFIQFLDSDDVVLPSKFEHQVAALMNSPAACACYGPCVQTEMLDLSSAELRALRPMRVTGQKVESLFPQMLTQRWWSTSSPLYRRSTLDEIGPWSTLRNEEDWEYDARLASLGQMVVWVSELVSVRRMHQNQLSDEGASDPQKLMDRCAARESIYESARYYEQQGLAPAISDNDWDEFSRYAFLLARQCALVGLKDAYFRLRELSAKAGVKRYWSHTIYDGLVRCLGVERAARWVQVMGK